MRKEIISEEKVTLDLWITICVAVQVVEALPSGILREIAPPGYPSLSPGLVPDLFEERGPVLQCRQVSDDCKEVENRLSLDAGDGRTADMVDSYEGAG